MGGKYTFLHGGEKYFRTLPRPTDEKRARERYEKFMKARGWL